MAGDASKPAQSDVPRYVRTDLPKKNQKPILQAVHLLYQRIFKSSEAKNKTRNDQRAELARSLKGSLDKSFGPQWHVLVGQKSAFACKKRNETMAVFKVEENQVVIWQSPGIEPLEEEEPPVQAEGEQEAGTEDSKDEKPAGAAVKVVEPSNVDKDSEEAQIIATLRDELGKTPCETDPQALAARVRKRLTKEHGTIWHVMAGSDFVVAPAVNRRNYCLVTVGKTRIVCFQHEQFMEGGGLRINWGKLMRAAPYLLLTIFCLAFMTMQAMCGEEDPTDPATAHPSKFRVFVRESLCKGDWESRMHTIGVAAIACMFLGRFTKKMGQAGAAAATKKQA